MSQQEFDNFKQRIKDWMDSHPEEYDCFEEEMNQKDNIGYQKILRMAFSLVPEYQKILGKKMNQGNCDDISDIETLFAEKKLADILINSFEKTPENSLVPAILSWLYFGKSFERMVERGEELRKNPKTTYLEKFTIAYMTKMLISKSKSLGLRTKEDWDEHRKLMVMADNGEIIDQTIQETFYEKKKAGRKRKDQTIPVDYLKPVESFLKSKNEKYDIACLKIALEEMSLINTGDVKSFRDFLKKQYGNDIPIILERGIQDAYMKLNDFVGEGKLVKDLKENRKNIDEIKEILSN